MCTKIRLCIVLLVIMALCQSVVAQTNYKYALIDKSGNMIVPPTFDDAKVFSNGFAAVKIDDKWGFINKSGTIVVTPQYLEVGCFSENLAWVQMEDYNVGFIDTAGKMVIQPKFVQASDFQDGYAKVVEGDIMEGESFFIDKSGKKYSSSAVNLDFSEGLGAYTASTRQGDKIGFKNRQGETVIQPIFDYFYPMPLFSEGLAAMQFREYIGSAELIQYGFIDKTGKTVIKPQFDAAKPFSEGLAAVYIDINNEDGSKGWGYIDKSGHTIIENQESFHYAGEFHDGLGLVINNGHPIYDIGERGFIDKAGNLVIAPQYEQASEFSEGISAVELNYKWGFINPKGKYVVIPEYDDVIGIKKTYLLRNNGIGYLGGFVEQWNILSNVCNEGLIFVGFDLGHYYRYYSELYEKCNNVVQTVWMECNKQLEKYPYNTGKIQLDSISMSSYLMDPRLSTITDSTVANLKQQTSEIMINCYQQLKSDNPKVFAEIYLQRHPEIKSVLEHLKLECRCNNYSEEQLVIWIADISLPQCSCRNDYWNQYSTLYFSRAEFDSLYNISEKVFIDDVSFRHSLKTDIQQIASMLAGLKSAKFKDGLTGKQEDVIQILRKVQYHKGKYYYGEVLEMMFSADAIMTKEWEKNGQYFSSKNEFYEAYISGYYKKILKGKTH